MSMEDITPLQAAMFAIVGIFQKHADKGGDKFTLSKGELNQLLQSQFKGLLGGANDQKKLDEMFQELDANSDNAVDFTEFMTVVTGITMALHEMFKSELK